MKKAFYAAAAATLVLGAIPGEPLTPPASAQATFMGETFTCETAGNDLARVINNNQAPSSAGTIPQTQNLMWMLQMGLNWLDSNCRGEDGYAAVRTEFQNSYNATMNLCRNTASNPGDCGPRRYQ
jgi:hypothetical protein